MLRPPKSLTGKMPRLAYHLASDGIILKGIHAASRQLELFSRLLTLLCAPQAREYVGALDWVSAVELTMSAQVRTCFHPHS